MFKISAVDLGIGTASIEIKILHRNFGTSNDKFYESAGSQNKSLPVFYSAL